MEKQNNVPVSTVSWALVGVRPHEEGSLPDEIVHKMTMEAFLEGKIYKLFLCGTEVDKTGTLAEMEEGYLLLKKNMEEYRDGDYCIISSHDEGSLLFLPTQIDETDVKDFSGDIDNLQ